MPARPAARRVLAGGAATLAAGTGLLLCVPGAALAQDAAAQAPTVVAAPQAPRTASAPKAMKVPIQKNLYQPTDMTVTLSQVVTWTNLDEAPHTVTTTSAPVKFDSGVFAKGKSFSYTFTTAGVYKYYCAVHPEMVGTVTVLEKGAKASKPAFEAGKDPEKKDAHSAHGDNTKSAKPKTDNAAPAGAGDSSKPSESHADNDKGAAAPGTSDNGTQTAPAAPSATPADPVSGAVDPFVVHLQNAHFNRAAGAQVQDIAELDSWGKSHLALLRQMLDYEVGNSSALGTVPMVEVFMKHLDAAHWNTSPMEQTSAIANFDSWNASHLAMFRIMFDSIVGKESVLGSTPGTSVFMQHLDAAHWNQSANAQAAAISDDAAGWTASHQVLAQRMVESAADGSKN